MKSFNIIIRTIYNIFKSLYTLRFVRKKFVPNCLQFVKIPAFYNNYRLVFVPVNEDFQEDQRFPINS